MRFILNIIKQVFEDFFIIALLIISLLLAYATNELFLKIGVQHENLFLFLFLLYFIGILILRSKK